MDITITGRNLDITDRFRDYATEKAERVSKLADRPIAFEIKVTRHSEPRGAQGSDKVELMLVGPGPLVRAESAASDKYAAFDIALDKLTERLRGVKDRRKIHRGNHRPVSLAEAAASGFSGVGIQPADAELIEKVATGSTPVVGEQRDEDAAESPVVIRQKVFPATRMSAEEAVDHMELVGHDFFLFVDAESDRPSVVYRRKGWAYGVISLGDEEPVARAVSS
ncbi:ribosome hibernation-promoting factor, HPF/YfiA family [Ruicaihuangia caeni]|uniref:Ribosome hibernation promoting factor n=1 Tax=Ruicaihuangia caeni TaxID=3042517 RepID=A0AAW6TC95_9MICO|nr:ribosome-associated translation inhibitor RaiA [Klugiella sp. YN-L-19]MDI2099453.1 ribosome-associated translation inhibitor RaiA [Klugiella sp. YN-L-19]